MRIFDQITLVDPRIPNECGSWRRTNPMRVWVDEEQEKIQIEYWRPLIAERMIERMEVEVDFKTFTECDIKLALAS